MNCKYCLMDDQRKLLNLYNAEIQRITNDNRYDY